jgi:hypothetical protein
MSMKSLQRQLLMSGLQAASGSVLWGKLRHLSTNEADETILLGDSVKEGGLGRSRSRKASD